TGDGDLCFDSWGAFYPKIMHGCEKVVRSGCCKTLWLAASRRISTCAEMSSAVARRAVRPIDPRANKRFVRARGRFCSCRGRALRCLEEIRAHPHSPG